MKDRAALAFPWVFFALILGLILWDQTRVRGTPAPSTPVAAGDEWWTVSIDPVCGMKVRTGASYPLTWEGQVYSFCCAACRETFEKAPTAQVQAPREGHLMLGVPTWMFQVGVAIVLVLSFGLFEGVEWLRSRRAPAAPAAPARIDVMAAPLARRLLSSGPLQAAVRGVMALFFLFLLGAGLFGNQNPAMNITPLLTWTIWWAGLIFVILFFGKLWCSVCPWDTIATWLERLSLWGPRRSGAGLGLKWPRFARNIWFAVILFVALTWVELGMGITLIPRATAWVGLGMLGLAIVCAFLFERKSFCRYGCLIGRVSGLYAMFSSVEVRRNSADVCASCKTADCFRGNEKGDGCPTFEFPRAMETSTYCILCAECLRTCPKENISLRLRPWGSDLVQEGRPRMDEAILAVILLSMTSFHGLTMTPVWPRWSGAVQGALSVSEWVAFSVIMAGMLAGPIALYAILSWAAARWSRSKSTGELFIAYSYALLPIALFYHLAHNAEHFLMEGPKVLALASDPMGRGWNLFGTAGWTPPPLVTIEGLWWIQVFMVLVGHVYSLWICSRTTRRRVPERGRAFVSQLPMLAAMVLFSVVSLWLLKQPMEMRSAM